MRVVVVGAGAWGVNYIRELGGHLVGVVETDADRARAVSETFNVRVYPELPRRLKFDAAVIATPPDSHHKLASPLLQAGKYVLVEKPLTDNVESAMELAGCKRCMVGHLYLYHPIIEEMKDWLSLHSVPHAFCRRTNSGPVRPWQDSAWDLASHDLSVLIDWFGDVLTIASAGTHDWSIMHVGFKNTDAAIYCSWLGGPKVRTIELVPQIGDRYIFDDVRTVLEVSPLRRMLDAFLSGSWDRCTAAEGAEVVRVLQAASAAISYP
jgi:predicted dehydrogenase